MVCVILVYFKFWMLNEKSLSIRMHFCSFLLFLYKRKKKLNLKERSYGVRKTRQTGRQPQSKWVQNFVMMCFYL